MLYGHRSRDIEGKLVPLSVRYKNKSDLVKGWLQHFGIKEKG